MKTILTSVALAMLLSLSACQSSPRANVWCLTNKPQRPSEAEIAAMLDARVREVLAHNRLGQKRCGWKP